MQAELNYKGEPHNRTALSSSCSEANGDMTEEGRDAQYNGFSNMFLAASTLFLSPIHLHLLSLIMEEQMAFSFDLHIILISRVRFTNGTFTSQQ